MGPLRDVLLDTEQLAAFRYWLGISQIRAYEYGAVTALRAMGFAATSRRVQEIEKRITVSKAAGDIVFELTDAELINELEGRPIVVGAGLAPAVVEDARKLIRDELFLGNASTGEGGISDLILAGGQVPEYRALRISRTETQSAFNQGFYKVEQRSGIKKHSWVTVGDRRVRPEHAMNEDSGDIPIGDPFASLQIHPGDPGPLVLHVNCRCSLQPDLSDPNILLDPWAGDSGANLKTDPTLPGIPPKIGKIRTALNQAQARARAAIRAEGEAIKARKLAEAGAQAAAKKKTVQESKAVASTKSEFEAIVKSIDADDTFFKISQLGDKLKGLSKAEAQELAKQLGFVSKQSFATKKKAIQTITGELKKFAKSAGDVKGVDKAFGEFVFATKPVREAAEQKFKVEALEDVNKAKSVLKGSTKAIDVATLDAATAADYAEFLEWQAVQAGKTQSYGVVIFDDQGRVLLRRAKGDFGGTRWSFAKGGGTKPGTTALKELAEETGHQANITGAIKGDFEGTTTKNNYFVGRKKGKFDAALMDAETEEVIWVDFNEAKKLIKQSPSELIVKRDLAVLDGAFDEISGNSTALKALAKKTETKKKVVDLGKQQTAAADELIDAAKQLQKAAQGDPEAVSKLSKAVKNLKKLGVSDTKIQELTKAGIQAGKTAKAQGILDNLKGKLPKTIDEIDNVVAELKKLQAGLGGLEAEVDEAVSKKLKSLGSKKSQLKKKLKPTAKPDEPEVLIALDIQAPTTQALKEEFEATVTKSELGSLFSQTEAKLLAEDLKNAGVSADEIAKLQKSGVQAGNEKKAKSFIEAQTGAGLPDGLDDLNELEDKVFGFLQKGFKDPALEKKFEGALKNIDLKKKEIFAKPAATKAEIKAQNTKANSLANTNPQSLQDIKVVEEELKALQNLGNLNPTTDFSVDSKLQVLQFKKSQLQKKAAKPTTGPTSADILKKAEAADAKLKAELEALDDIKIITEPIPKPIKVDLADFPPADKLGRLDELKTLPGSTGAKLVQDPRTGKKYVLKRGNQKLSKEAREAHLREEFLADDLYRAAGVDVPAGVLYETASGPVKLTEFIEGTEDLATVLAKGGSRAKKVLTKIQGDFAEDALFANWDVIGLSQDNILVTKTGKVLRIDNGGALRFRAQGAPKGSHFGNDVGELASLRSSAAGKEVFGQLTDEAVAKQIFALQSKREVILATIKDRALRATISKRLDSMKTWADDVIEKIATRKKNLASGRKLRPGEFSNDPVAIDPRIENRATFITPKAKKAAEETAPLREMTKKLRDLGPREHSAIEDYSGSSYRRLNSNLRKGKSLTDDQLQMVKGIDVGLAEVPSAAKEHPVVFRKLEQEGQKLEAFLAKHPEGGIVSYNEYLSTSFSKGTWSGNIEYEIRHKTGRRIKEISLHRSEDEVLFGRGAEFLVERVERTGNRVKIFLTEL
jgi:8-oxo-dGTP pyrophosphatase MutT (NUDIX family)